MESTSAPLVVNTERGLYCPPGDFYIDPWQPVERAVITHAHGDHARPGHAHYLAAKRGLPVLRTRMGQDAKIEGLAYGESRTVGGGKILGQQLRNFVPHYDRDQSPDAQRASAAIRSATSIH